MITTPNFNHFNLFVYEAPEDRGGGATDGGEGVASDTPAATETPAWTGPSQEEWEQTREAIQQVTGVVPTVQQMNQVLQQLTAEPERDDDDFDIGEYIQQEINRGLAPIIPIVNSAAQESGKKRMADLLTGHEKSLGKFDHTLAERVANSYYNETGDAVKAVEAGAKFAADYRKQERDAGIEEYKASLKRPGPSDLPVDSGGNSTVPKAKSYDEVVERWAGTTEV